MPLNTWLMRKKDNFHKDIVARFTMKMKVLRTFHQSKQREESFISVFNSLFLFTFVYILFIVKQPFNKKNSTSKLSEISC